MQTTPEVPRRTSAREASVVPRAERAVELERALWALRAYDTTALATVSAAGPHVAGVFFAPERNGAGLCLLLALRFDTRTHRDIFADPRVAFMCSPGNSSRWVQGSGRANLVTDTSQHHELYMRLLDHAPGARPFVEDSPVLPALVQVERLKVVEEAGRPPLLIDLTGAG